MTQATLQAKANRIGQMLAVRYPETPIPLHHRDPYTLLVAVLLSAQCTDKRVNQVTPNLWQLANNPAAMAAQPVDAIRAIIRPCGLSPTKSRNIKALSQILVTHHNGKVPVSFEALEALPGVGHKTASVVMSQAFGVPAFPVDTHIKRLARRWGLTSSNHVPRIERDLKALFPQKDWNKLHLRFIFFGREVCTARGHHPADCPICSWAANPVAA